MKKNIFTIGLMLCISSANLLAQNNKISALDFKPLIGHWQGSLTYFDYQTNKPYTMPADLDVTQFEECNCFVFSNIYPNEPNANAKDTINLSKNGIRINEQMLFSKHKKNGLIEITTMFAGVDGNNHRAALIKHIYTIGLHVYSIVKEVNFVGDSKWIKRHEYRYQRN